MNAISKYKMGLIFLGLMTTMPLSAAKKINFTEPKARYSGLTVFQTNEGSGLGGYFEYSLKNADRLAAQVTFTIVTGDDYPLYYYDSYGQYYYYESASKRRLSFLHFLGGYKKILFADKIANDFRPYLECLGGAVMALDPPNVPDFSDRIKKMTTAWVPGFQIGGGIDFLSGPRTLVSIFAGYDYLKFSQKIDPPQVYYDEEGNAIENSYSGQKDFSGLVIKISFGKKF